MTAMFLNEVFKPIYTVGAAECGRAEFKFRYLNNGYNYDSNILQLFLYTLSVWAEQMMKEYWVNRSHRVFLNPN